MNEEIDNIDAAMERVAEVIEPTRPYNTNSAEGETAQRQVLIRATERDHDRWKEAASIQGISTSEFIRNACNAEVSKLLDCQHPEEFRKIYPWSDVCLKCGTRFR
jgi:predicted DNA binding CopG/RHH family protein